MPRNKDKMFHPKVQMLDGSDNDALLECIIAMLVQHDEKERKKMFHAQNEMVHMT